MEEHLKQVIDLILTIFRQKVRFQFYEERSLCVCEKRTETWSFHFISSLNQHYTIICNSPLSALIRLVLEDPLK